MTPRALSLFVLLMMRSASPGAAAPLAQKDPVVCQGTAACPSRVYYVLTEEGGDERVYRVPITGSAAERPGIPHRGDPENDALSRICASVCSIVRGVLSR